MNRSALNLLIAAVLVIGVGGVVLTQKRNTVQTGVSGTATSTSLTIADVARHNTREDCWTVINGGLYDLTSWIPEHPGGEEAILMLCGVDGSAAFNGKHGEAPKQAAILTGFRIGELEGYTTPQVNSTVDDND